MDLAPEGRARSFRGIYSTILNDEIEPCRDSNCRIHAEINCPPYVAPSTQAHCANKGPSIGHRLVSFFRDTFKRTSNGTRADAVPEQVVYPLRSTSTPVVSYLHKPSTSYHHRHPGTFPSVIKSAAPFSSAGGGRSPMENIDARDFRSTESETRRPQIQPNSNVKKSVVDKQILAYSYVHKQRKASRKRRVISDVQTPENQSASNSSDPPQETTKTTERPSLIVSPEASTERMKSGVTRRIRFSLHPSTPNAPIALIKQPTKLSSAESSTEAPSFYSSSIQLSVTPVVESVTEGQQTSKVHSRVTFQTTGETKYVTLPAASSRGCLEAGRKPSLAKTNSQCLCSPLLPGRPSRPLLSPPPPSIEHVKPFSSSRHVEAGDERKKENQVSAAIETGGIRTNSKEDDGKMKLLPSIGTSYKGGNFIETFQQKDRLNYLTQVENRQIQDCPTQGSRIQKTRKQGDQDRQAKVRKRVDLGYEKHGLEEGEGDSDDDDIYRIAEAVPHGVHDTFGDDSTFFDSSLLWGIEHELGERSSDEDTLDVIRVMKEVERSFQTEERANLLSEEPTREAPCENSHTVTSRAEERADDTPNLLSSTEDIACSSSFPPNAEKILGLQEEALPVQEVEVLTVPSHWRIFADTHRREHRQRGVENSPSICVSVLVRQLPIDVVLKSFEDPILNNKSVQTYGGQSRGAHSCRTEMLPRSPRRLCCYHRYLSNLREESWSTGGLSRTHSASTCRLTHGGRSHECSRRQHPEEYLQRSRSVPNLQTTSDTSKFSGQENQDFTLIFNLWREITRSLKELQRLAGSSGCADVGTLTSPAVRSKPPNEPEPATAKYEEPNSVDSLETSLQISSPKEFSEICLSPIPKPTTIDTPRRSIAELRELIARRSRLQHQPGKKLQTIESQYCEDWAEPVGKGGASRGDVSELALKRGTRSLTRGSAKSKVRNRTLNTVECAFDQHHPHTLVDSHRAAFSGRNEREVSKHVGSTLPSRKCTKSYDLHAYRTYRSGDEDSQTNSRVSPSFDLNSNGPLNVSLATAKAVHVPAVWGDSTETDSSGDDNSYLLSSGHLCSASSPPRHMFFHRLPSPTPAWGCTPKGSTRGSLRSSSVVREEKIVSHDAHFLRSRPVADSGRFPGSFGDGGRSKSWDRRHESMQNVEWEDLINEIYTAMNARRLPNGGHRPATFQLTPSSQYTWVAPAPRAPSSFSGRSDKARPALRDNLLRHTIASLQKVRERKEDMQGSPRKPWVKY